MFCYHSSRRNIVADVILKNMPKLEDYDHWHKDFTIKINDGELFVLLGQYNRGTRLILNMITGAHPISRGEIYIGGKLINNIPGKKRNVALLPTQKSVFPQKTVYDNIAFRLKLRGIGKKEIPHRVHKAAVLTSTEHLLNYKFHEITQNQQLYVRVACTLALKPAVLLLDRLHEDPLYADKTTRLFLNFVKNLNKQRNMTIIYATPRWKEAMILADRIAVISSTLLQTGTPQELYTHPADSEVARMFGDPSMNFILSSLVKKKNKIFIDCNDTILELHPDIAAPYLHLVGKEFMLGFRPEDIYTPDNAPGGTKTGLIDVYVEAIENRGHAVILDLSTHNFFFKGYFAPPIFPSIGDKIKVALCLNNIKIFPF